MFGILYHLVKETNKTPRGSSQTLLQLAVVSLLVSSYDASFLPWLKYLQSSLRDSFLTKTGLEPLPDDALLEPQWLLGLSEDHDANGECMAQTLPRAIVQDKEEIKSRAISPVDDVKWLHAALEDNRRITPTTHWQDVRHLKFTVQGIVPYEPGDLVTIYPRNTTEDVEELMRLMGWGSVAERSVLFVPNARYPMVAMMAAPSLTGPMSLRKLLTNHLDINAIPRRSFFAILAHFSTDAFQRSRLLEFTKPDFVDELYDYTTRPRRSILEVLQEFSTVKVPWQWAAVVLPELRGRQFSIASGGELKRNANDLSTRFELLVAIVQYRTVIRKTRRGVCTRYLGGLSVGTSLLVSLHKGNLGVSQVDFTRPIIMIGPGTGVAPMRSLIWERQAWNMQPGGTIDGYDSGNQENYWSNGRSVLFFGCRNEDSDYFFRHEWNELEKTTSFKVFTAFSRDQIQRIYVQDVIKSHGELVYDILGRSQGIVYVCGSSGKMPMAVREALVSVFQTFGNLEREKAELYLSAMEKESRYKQETW